MLEVFGSKAGKLGKTGSPGNVSSKLEDGPSICPATAATLFKRLATLLAAPKARVGMSPAEGRDFLAFCRCERGLSWLSMGKKGVQFIAQPRLPDLLRARLGEDGDATLPLHPLRSLVPPPTS